MSSSDEWYDLTSAVIADAFHAAKVLVMSPQGVGDSVILALRDKQTEGLHSFLISESLAVQLGWLLIGVSSEYIEASGLEEGLFGDADEEDE